MARSAAGETNLSALKDSIFHGELLLYMLDFVKGDARTISSFQQTCKANREWRSAELATMKDVWRWKAIEKIVGKKKTGEIKQGAALELSLIHI